VLCPASTLSLSCCRSCECHAHQTDCISSALYLPFCRAAQHRAEARGLRCILETSASERTAGSQVPSIHCDIMNCHSLPYPNLHHPTLCRLALLSRALPGLISCTTHIQTQVISSYQRDRTRDGVALDQLAGQIKQSSGSIKLLEVRGQLSPCHVIPCLCAMDRSAICNI
jgi:hypothetical protein